MDTLLHKNMTWWKIGQELSSFILLALFSFSDFLSFLVTSYNLSVWFLTLHSLLSWYIFLILSTKCYRHINPEGQVFQECICVCCWKKFVLYVRNWERIIIFCSDTKMTFLHNLKICLNDFISLFSKYVRYLSRFDFQNEILHNLLEKQFKVRHNHLLFYSFISF